MTRCRSCGGKLDGQFLSLGKTPLSNAFVTEEGLHRGEIYYPLNLYVCPNCLLVQAEDFENPEHIFSADYAYFSSYSESWLKHCEDYVLKVIRGLGLDKNSLVIEVASNDGYLLQYFQQHNIPVLGVEPAANTAEVAIKKGIPTERAFFNTVFAQTLKNSGFMADLMIANNVLAHNPDLNDFVEGFEVCLKPGGVITMEFPHLLQLVSQNQFDTIYHEHYSYFSLYAVKRLFAAHKLDIFRVEELPTHGGSLRIYAKRSDDPTGNIEESVSAVLEKERNSGLLSPDTYFAFGERVKKVKRALLEFLIEAKNSGKRIAAYGAPAKGNTLLNYCGIRTDFIDYTVDLNPFKQGKYLPGTNIPVYAPSKIMEDRPDYVLILPWNIKDEVMLQMAFVVDWGGKFVIPIPEIEIVP
jgi:hypothetical protein